MGIRECPHAVTFRTSRVAGVRSQEISGLRAFGARPRARWFNEMLKQSLRWPGHGKFLSWKRQQVTRTVTEMCPRGSGLSPRRHPKPTKEEADEDENHEKITQSLSPQAQIIRRTSKISCQLSEGASGTPVRAIFFYFQWHRTSSMSRYNADICCVLLSIRPPAHSPPSGGDPVSIL
jgi:hypothetical protein